MTGVLDITAVTTTKDEGIVVAGNFQSDEIIINSSKLYNSGNSTKEAFIVKYNSKGKVEWADSFKGSDNDYIYSLTSTEEGKIIVGGKFNSDQIEVGNNILSKISGNYKCDGLIVIYSNEGKVEWSNNIGGDSSINTINVTSDGGYLVGGDFKETIEIENDVYGTIGSTNGIIIKYNSAWLVEWVKTIKVIDNFVGFNSIVSVTETKNEKIIIGGNFNDNINIGEYSIESQGNDDGMLLEIEKEKGIPEVQELTVENNIKEFKITTDVNEANGTRGGSISGEDEASYETVKYGDNSTKQIIMTPDENYEIIGITVNGEEWQFTANADGTYTMPQFTNMTEDKHIVVTYALKSNKITINKVDSADNSKKLEGAIFEITSEDGTAIN